VDAVAVFCGSNFGASPVYREAMHALGTTIGAAGCTLVYGGTHRGLMGVVADAALAAGGRVHGVITQRLVDRGHLHARLTSHEVVDSMAARKSRMAHLANGYIATPGGIGTMDEFCSVWSLAQLEDTKKPCALYDVAGYFAPFMAFVDGMVAAQFLKDGHRDMLVRESDPQALLARMRSYEAPTILKWF
jgi:uncharacterized protein (TIGR00730 family)